MVAKSLEAAPIAEIRATTLGASIGSEKDPIIIERRTVMTAPTSTIYIVVSGRQWERSRRTHSFLRELGLFRIGRLTRSEQRWMLA